MICEGEANVHFEANGMLRKLRANVDDATVGDICYAVLGAAQSSGFEIDPSTDKGAQNRLMGGSMVQAGIFTQAEADAFFALGESVSYPFASKTEYDFQVAKGTLKVVEVQNTIDNKFALVTTTKNLGGHSAKVLNANDVTVGYIDILDVGTYACEVNEKLRTPPYKIEDFYGVI